MIPIIQKIQVSPQCFVERQLPPDSGKIFVEEGDKVRPFDFVAEVKSNHQKRLTAGVAGEIVKILPQKAVLIKSSGITVRGVFGHGEDSEGEIIVLTGNDQPLGVDVVDEKVRGKILVGGFLTSLEAVKKAEALLASGVVCGGVNLDILPKTPLTILVTEGFGQVSLNPEVFEFLKKVEGRHVFLSPDHKELLVTKRFGDNKDTLDQFDHLPQETDAVWVSPRVGQTVQVLTAKHFGQIGKIRSLPKRPTRLPSGIVTTVVEVKLDPPEAGGKISVPERNVGVIK